MNKESNFPFPFLGFVALFVVTFMFSYSIGVLVGKEQVKQRAISEGVAKYTVNPTNGETKFEFIKP